MQYVLMLNIRKYDEHVQELLLQIGVSTGGKVLTDPITIQPELTYVEVIFQIY